MKKFSPILLAGVLALSTSLLSQPAEAQFGRIRETIRNLWGQNAAERHEARAARNRAKQAKAGEGGLRSRLQKSGNAFLQANSVYLNVHGQIKETEAKIVETRHRIQIVQVRYEDHKKLFGQRLAAMQRNGQIGYLNVLLGSRTLSDLSRRAYLYQAIAERDSDLQNQIKNDREELQEAKNFLDAQWQQRNRLQQDAMRERKRVIQAQRETLAQWKRTQHEVYTNLAFAGSKADSAKRARQNIYELEAERDRIEAAYERQREEYSRRYVPQRRYRRSRSYRRYRSSRRRSYRTRRYRTYRATRRVRRDFFMPSEGGVLKPMAIEKLEVKTVKVPVEPRGGVLNDDYVAEDAPN